MYFNNNDNNNKNANVQHQVCGASNDRPRQETASDRLHAGNNESTDIVHGNGQRLVDDLTNRLDQMNVDLLPIQNNAPFNCQTGHTYPNGQDNNNFNIEFQIERAPYERNIGQQFSMSIDEDDLKRDDDQTLMNTNEQLSSGRAVSGECRRDHQERNILIVTNLDSSLFSDKQIKAKFESLFKAYDANVTFRYLKSFRRVRLDFSSAQMAEQARFNLNNYKLGNSIFKCYVAQIIKPNYDKSNSLDDQDSSGSEYSSNTYLKLPKPTKQFLISPPASPPVDWEPAHEGSPCIDVQLISALANLVPGEMHEIHPGNESQPGIFVQVCEEVRFEGGQGRRIPKTASPSAAR